MGRHQPLSSRQPPAWDPSFPDQTSFLPVTRRSAGWCGVLVWKLPELFKDEKRRITNGRGSKKIGLRGVEFGPAGKRLADAPNAVLQLGLGLTGCRIGFQKKTKLPNSPQNCELCKKQQQRFLTPPQPLRRGVALAPPDHKPQVDGRVLRVS